MVISYWNRRCRFKWNRWPLVVPFGSHQATCWVVTQGADLAELGEFNWGWLHLWKMWLARPVLFQGGIDLCPKIDDGLVKVSLWHGSGELSSAICKLMFLFIGIYDRALHESPSRDFPCPKKRILWSFPCHARMRWMLLYSALVVLTWTFHGYPIIEDWGIHVDQRYAIWVNISVVLIFHLIHPVHYVGLIA